MDFAGKPAKQGARPDYHNVLSCVPVTGVSICHGAPAEGVQRPCMVNGHADVHWPLYNAFQQRFARCMSGRVNVTSARRISAGPPRVER
jgi:hypothetical protein